MYSIFYRLKNEVGWRCERNKRSLVFIYRPPSSLQHLSLEFIIFYNGYNNKDTTEHKSLDEYQSRRRGFSWDYHILFKYHYYIKLNEPFKQHDVRSTKTLTSSSLFVFSVCPAVLFNVRLNVLFLFIDFITYQKEYIKWAKF